MLTKDRQPIHFDNENPKENQLDQQKKVAREKKTRVGNLMMPQNRAVKKATESWFLFKDDDIFEFEEYEMFYFINLAN